MAPTPDGTARWLQTLLPVLREGGPILTLGLAVVMSFSLWWMSGWLTDCIEHNRQLGQRLVDEQHTFRAEILARLAHCPPVQAPR